MKNLLLLCIFISCFLNVFSQGLNVHNLSSSSYYASIQLAIDSAQSGDTILVAEGTYYEALNFQGKDLYLTSDYEFDQDSSSIQNTILATTPNAVVLTIENGESSAATLNGFTVKDVVSYPFASGFLNLNHSAFTVTNTRIIDFTVNSSLPSIISIIEMDMAELYMHSIEARLNHALVTGFFYADSSTITIEHSDFVENEASFFWLYDSELNVYNSNFSYSGYDNFMYLNGCETTIDSCVFDHLYPGLSLWAFRLNSNVSFSFTNSTYSNTWGGFAEGNAGDFFLENSRISYNYSQFDILSLEYMNFSGHQVLFNSNRTVDLPWAIDFENCTGILSNATVYNNSAFWSEEDAGVHVTGGEMHLVNSILFENHADGITCYGGKQTDLTCSTNTHLSHCHVFFVNGIPSDEGGNIFQSDPDFETYYQDWAISQGTGYFPGPELTLSFYSECIDAGIPFYVYNGDTLLNMESNSYEGSAPDLGWSEYAFNPVDSFDMKMVDIMFVNADDEVPEWNDTLKVEIYNRSSMSVDAGNVFLEVNGLTTSAPIISTITSNSTSQLMLVLPDTLNPGQFYDFHAWVEVTGDANASNDSIHKDLFTVGNVYSIPHFEDFENSIGGWRDGGQNSAWIYDQGIPGNGMGYSQGYYDTVNTFHWISSMQDMLCTGHRSWLKSPHFNIAGKDSIAISFIYYLYEAYTEIAVGFQYHFDGDSTWLFLGQEGDPYNWYNGYDNRLNDFGISTGAWLATNHYVLQPCSHSLVIPTGKNYVQFRFVVAHDYSQGPGFHFDNFEVYELPLDQQEIELRQGWNLFSSYITSKIDNMGYLISPIEANLTLMKNDQGEIYWPSAGVHQMGQFMNNDGYLTKLNFADTLIISGAQILPDTTQVHLDWGWNYLPYYRNSTMNYSTALSSIQSDIILMKDEDGKVNWPQYSVYMIPILHPDKAYQVKMDQNVSFTYPPN